MYPVHLNHATLQIFSGTVRNVFNQFLVERRSRGLSPNTIRFYVYDLERFCGFVDDMGVIQLEELTADVIRKFILYLESQGHNPGGIHRLGRRINRDLTDKTLLFKY